MLLAVITLTVGAIWLIAGGTISTSEPYYEEPLTEECNKDTIYIEKDAGLMWQDATYGDKEDGAYKQEYNNRRSGDWAYASRYCQDLGYAGYYDWRLPTSDELMNLSRKERVLQDNRGADFWTSTKAQNGLYYVVYTVDAYRFKRDPKQSNYIRCVRCLDEK